MTDLTADIAAFERDEPGLIAAGFAGMWAIYTRGRRVSIFESAPTSAEAGGWKTLYDDGATLIRQIGAPIASPTPAPSDPGDAYSRTAHESMSSAITTALFAEMEKQAPADEFQHVTWNGDWGNLHYILANALEAARYPVPAAAPGDAIKDGDLAKAYLLNAGPDYAKGGFEFVMRTPVGAALAEFMAECLRAEGAPNFIAVTATHDELGPIEFIVQRVSGSAKTTQKALAERNDALKAAADTFRRYAALHRAKGTPDGDEKAKANDAEADRIDNVLAGREP